MYEFLPDAHGKELAPYKEESLLIECASDVKKVSIDMEKRESVLKKIWDCTKEPFQSP